MFDAIFTASSGQSFSFGYKAGVLYSIDPIGDLPVELETSQRRLRLRHPPAPDADKAHLHGHAGL